MNLHSILTVTNDLLFWTSTTSIHEGCRFSEDDPRDIDSYSHHGCAPRELRDFVLYCECRGSCYQGTGNRTTASWFHYFNSTGRNDHGDSRFHCNACNAGHCPRPPE